MKKDELRKVLEEMPKMKLIELFIEFSDGGEGRFWYANIFENFEKWYEVFDAPEVESVKADFEENIGDMESPVRYSMGELKVVDIDDVYSDCVDGIDDMIDFLWAHRNQNSIKEAIETFNLCEYFKDIKTGKDIKDDVNTLLNQVKCKFNLSSNWYSDFRKSIVFDSENELYLAKDEKEYNEVLGNIKINLINLAAECVAKQELISLVIKIQSKYDLPDHWYGRSVYGIDVLGAYNPYSSLQYAIAHDEKYDELLEKIENALTDYVIEFKSSLCLEKSE